MTLVGDEKTNFKRREFSFNILIENEDIYCRYLCFDDSEEFKKELIKKCPIKIDIGAVYNQ